jgi:uncharacterized protein
VRWKRVFVILFLVAVAAGGWWYSRPDYKPVPPQIACLVGLYRLDDGRLVDLAPLTNAAALRWRLVDGRSGRLVRGDDGRWQAYRGWTDTADTAAITPGRCDAPGLTFEGVGGRRVELIAQDTRFRSDGEELAGRLVLPPGDTAVPVAVLVHGSESYSALTYYYLPRLLAAHGIGVFVYDKRGTGGSTGRYTQDFDRLANDAVAALKEARRLAGARAARAGFFGGSQAGWIAPLAATRSDAAFVAIGYGLADSPLAEDRDQVMLDLKRRGHGPEVLAKAREVTDATAVVMASGFRDGYDALAAVRDKYDREPWWQDMKGEFTGELANRPAFLLRWIGPLYDEGTSWRHDPMPTLHALKTPLLWVLAGADREAPPEETRARLLSVAQAGGRVTLVEFPGTDHGMLEFVESADGSRERTRIAEGYHALVIDWIRDGRAGSGPYGRAEFLTRSE